MFQAGRTVCIFLLTACAAVVMAADLPGAAADGWYSWQVDVVDSAPELCCISWINGVAGKKHCNLDGRHGGFNAIDNNPFLSDTVRIYTFMRSGEATKIRVLSSQCPVSSDSAIMHLGPVAAAESVDWMQRQVALQTNVSADAITAAALHAGDRAQMLIHQGREDPDAEVRSQAWFWLAQSESDQAFVFVERLLSED